MKFKKLGSICKAKGMFCLYNEMTEAGEFKGQWLGTSSATYPLDNLPLMDTDSLCAVFDITEKQKENIIFRNEPLPPSVNFGENDPSDTILQRAKIRIIVESHELVPLQDKHNAVVAMIDTEYLAPLADVADELELYLRTMEDDMQLIVAKVGLYLGGVIAPYRMQTEWASFTLNQIAAASRRDLEKTKKDGEL